MSSVKKVLLIGSGALQIGQAGEFDYSGSQALKALREENIRSVLVNPNIATVQTGEGLADTIYLEPVDADVITSIIQRERVDGVFLGFGGQSALNCGLQLHDRGVFAEHGVTVLGTSIESIRDSEDRQRFATRLRNIGIDTPRSIFATTIEEAREAVRAIGLPFMIRLGFALGGKGSAIVEDPALVEPSLQRAFRRNETGVLVEESLRGWKEIEYEIVRDRADNSLAVCNMENFDPMGIHTGESIVVAPSQTLDDHDYQMLRSAAIRIARHFEIIGECNVQFALDPKSRRYRVIEMNPRLSRSSALASKATGYPIAYVAAKIALGHDLPTIPNSITLQTTAFHEPAMDYLVCKIPRWDLTKFGGSVKTLGSEMKSVGEIMAIGRSFPEVLQKGLRMLDIGVDGLDPSAFDVPDLENELVHATPRRVFAIATALHRGWTVEQISKLTGIDTWFLVQLREVLQFQHHLEQNHAPLERESLLRAKQLGFSDRAIDGIARLPPGTARNRRQQLAIFPAYAQIDTTAAEFPAQTNYLYSTYFGSSGEFRPAKRPRILILGSGVFRIGSSVEFDWSCVSAAAAASAAGFETLMLNCNPETVSTDYDTCDCLVFDEITLESALELCRIAEPEGVIVSMGGQSANNLALKLQAAGVRVLGTAADSIDKAEDRAKFGQLLDRLQIEQPRWRTVTEESDLEHIVEALGGYPVIVRPSYVLSGATMSVVHERAELLSVIKRAQRVSREHPVVVTKFESHSREFEIDAVACEGKMELWAITEHIEDAGVHSGDATLVLPPQTLSLPTIRRAQRIAEALASALRITGPYNVQFISKLNDVKVIECNLRASRSLPFVSKVTGVNFAAHATRRILGVGEPMRNDPLALDHVGVKAPMFSFPRLLGVDPVLGVEMASTGEVGCVSQDYWSALRAAAMSTGFKTPKRGALLSFGPYADKFSLMEEAVALQAELGLSLYATAGTCAALRQAGLVVTEVTTDAAGESSAVELMSVGKIDFVINITRSHDESGRPDGYQIRRAAVDMGIPLVTDSSLAKALVAMLLRTRNVPMQPVALHEILEETRIAQAARLGG